MTGSLLSACGSCGRPGLPGASFCQYCGTSLGPVDRPLVCPDCQTVNPAGTNFCHACGRRLRAPSVQPAGAAGGADGALPGRLVAVRRDGTDGPSFPLDGDQMDIGRQAGDLMFDDPHLAARHVRLLRRAGSWVVVPLENRNGVYVRTRGPVEVFDGDHILLGKQVLRFEVVPDVERTLRPGVEQGVVLFGTPVRPPWGRLRQMTSAGTTRDVYHLTRSDVTLGREQGDVVFSDDEFMSRRHAQIRFRSGRIELEDLGSSNGTYVRLRSQHVLAPGEMIRMGDELLRFELV